jgi:internalin A
MIHGGISAETFNCYQMGNSKGEKMMGKSKKLAIAAGVVLVIIASFHIYPSETDVVKGMEPWLIKDIADNLHKPVDKITADDFSRVTHLDWSCSDIQLIPEAISKFSNLCWLRLENNLISDVLALANFPNLNELWLRRNQVKDVEPLTNIITLTWLDLGYNQINDTKPLANLTNLVSLWLDHNQIKDVSPLANLKFLTYLDLRDNQISAKDIAELEAKLPNCWIVSAKPKKNKNQLLEKGQNRNTADDMVPFLDKGIEPWLVKVISEKVWDTNNGEFSSIGGEIISRDILLEVQELNLDRFKIKSIPDSLAKLKHLTRLFLNDNQISDVAPLANLTFLYSLIIFHNQIKDVSPLANLKYLRMLDLRFNPISEKDIAELKKKLPNCRIAN